MFRLNCRAGWAVFRAAAVGLALGCKPSSSTTAEKPAEAVKSTPAAPEMTPQVVHGAHDARAARRERDAALGYGCG